MDRNRRDTPIAIIDLDGCPPKPVEGLYVHVPFCRTKCGYCDFDSVPLGARSPAALVAALCKEITLRMSPSPVTLATTFIGGGTPTILDNEVLSRLLQTVSDAGRGHPLTERTVEANPTTVDRRKADLLVRYGIDRVSIGAQSFHADELKSLDRLHEPEDVPAAVRAVRAAGIDNVNLDLIFGIPRQTMDTWLESLHRALELEPAHVACYGLTYEPGTVLTRRLHQGRVQACDEGLEAEMYTAAIDLLAAAGFEQYEISNFARPGRACRHNLIYWNHDPYIGVGPSAAGYVNGRRYRNIPDHLQYTSRMHSVGDAVDFEETLTDMQVAAEMIMLNLRRIRGIQPGEFYRRTGIDLLATAAPAIERLEAADLVAASPAAIRLTRSGLLVADAVIAELAAAVGRPDCARPLTRTLSGSHPAE